MEQATKADCRSGNAAVRTDVESLCKNGSTSALRDVSLSLPQLLGALECPEVGERELTNLARTPQERREIEALLRLWQSLGRPTGKFWLETRTFYNRIALG